MNSQPLFAKRVLKIIREESMITGMNFVAYVDALVEKPARRCLAGMDSSSSWSRVGQLGLLLDTSLGSVVGDDGREPARQATLCAVVRARGIRSEFGRAGLALQER